MTTAYLIDPIPFYVRTRKRGYTTLYWCCCLVAALAIVL
jgi:hypothetical protein